MQKIGKMFGIIVIFFLILGAESIFAQEDSEERRKAGEQALEKQIEYLREIQTKTAELRKVQGKIKKLQEQIEELKKDEESFKALIAVLRRNFFRHFWDPSTLRESQPEGLRKLQINLIFKNDTKDYSSQTKKRLLKAKIVEELVNRDEVDLIAQPQSGKRTGVTRRIDFSVYISDIDAKYIQISITEARTRKVVKVSIFAISEDTTETVKEVVDSIVSAVKK